jgi:hypothetical protein
MWSDRLERIAKCMDELEVCRKAMQCEEPTNIRMAIQIGECDQLTELHRLLWEI